MNEAINDDWVKMDWKIPFFIKFNIGLGMDTQKRMNLFFVFLLLFIIIKTIMSLLLLQNFFLCCLIITLINE